MSKKPPIMLKAVVLTSALSEARAVYVNGVPVMAFASDTQAHEQAPKYPLFLPPDAVIEFEKYPPTCWFRFKWWARSLL